MAPNDNWISKKVQGYVSGAGNYVGGSIQGVGNGVNGVGRSIGDRYVPSASSSQSIYVPN